MPDEAPPNLGTAVAPMLKCEWRLVNAPQLQKSALGNIVEYAQW
jgi:hypothetical protein